MRTDVRDARTRAIVAESGSGLAASRRMTSSISRRVTLGLVLFATACGTDVDYGEVESEVTVGSYTSSSCSTSVVLGLSRQIAEEVGCMTPGALVSFSPTKNLVFSSNAVLPYLSEAAKGDLLEVADTKSIQVNSGFRTVAQQYLLYRWFQLGRCGISAAATPGRSNHESGRALDVANYSSVISAMSSRNWSHSVPGDPVHFDHLGSPDNRGKDVLAFQRLWNRNNPNDAISEDGAYGPQTEQRLRATEATGFAVGASCTPRAEGADVVMIDGPDKMAPGAKGHMQITVVNRSTTDWLASARLVVAGGEASQLYDQASWTSPTELGTLGSDVGAGAMHVIELDIATPMVSEETALFTQVSIVDDTGTHGTFNLALTVTPNGDEDTSGDSDDEHDDAPIASGGCDAGGGAGWLGALLPALIVLRTRRRRS